MSYTVYILYIKSIEKFYVGYTNDLQRRLGEHNRKKHKFTQIEEYLGALYIQRRQ